MKADVREFTRKLKLREKFWNEPSDDPSLVRENSNYNPKTNNTELAKIIEEIEFTEPTTVVTDDNLPHAERVALDELKSYKDIVIKKADKGSTVVIMDSQYYEDKLVLSDHLNNREIY